MLLPDDGLTTRPWQQIAAQAAIELDSRKLLALVEELNRAFAQQNKKQIGPENKGD
jgi:hypothetical protein